MSKGSYVIGGPSLDSAERPTTWTDARHQTHRKRPGPPTPPVRDLEGHPRRAPRWPRRPGMEHGESCRHAKVDLTRWGTSWRRRDSASVGGGAATEQGPCCERRRLADRRADHRPDDDIAGVVHAGVHA